jgi:predicted unusual protein kinase regulating ubiquinone biosynthesis (AarF/ABC1/UbiB family)
VSADKPAKLPGSRLARLASLAKLGVRTGASALRGDDGTGAAEKAAEVLGNLRGLAAKVGQMASYVDGLVPEGQRNAYEASLRALRSQAPRSSAAEIRGVVEAELDAPIDRLFVTWEDAPVASASIGQVHRATLHDGRVVAVKVQHPNVRQAVESDLASAGVPLEREEDPPHVYWSVPRDWPAPGARLGAIEGVEGDTADSGGRPIR